MKTTLFAALMAAVAMTATAQAPNVYKLLAADSPATMPYTTVRATLHVEREVVKTGPYARYAQKFLGVIAPLADRTTYTVTSAELDYATPDHKLPTRVAPLPHSVEPEFARVSIDRASTIDKSTEEMAREAANTLFRLRQQRLDILTGDAGELYPGGVGAALSEITRLESEYLALFLGKQATTVTAHEFDVVPTAGKNDYVVCDFSQSGGVGSSGGQVVLTMKGEGGARAMYPAKGDKRPMAQYRVADFAACRLSLGNEDLASARIPVYQFGITILAPAE